MKDSWRVAVIALGAFEFEPAIKALEPK